MSEHIVTKRYVVMHDYGTEGWSIRAQCDSVLEAVIAREDDLRNVGGVSLIFEHISPFVAYRQAEYQLEQERRREMAP